MHWLSKTAESPPNQPYKAPEAHGRTWDRGGGNHYNRSYMHKTKSVDYGILFSGERVMELDDCTLTLKPGDIVIDVGAWHLWDSSRTGCMMAFDMFDADVRGWSCRHRAGQRHADAPARKPEAAAGREACSAASLPSTASRASRALSADTPSPDVRTDPARPGFAMHRMWVVDSCPAKIVYETLHLPHVLVPPASGFGAERVHIAAGRELERQGGTARGRGVLQVGGRGRRFDLVCRVQPHPYMQKTRTLDLCVVLEGEITLVLDTQEVAVKQGEFAIIRGSNHAWSNRSGKPAVVAIACHDAR